LSLRDLEEIMRDRGIDVDHSTIGRWVVKYSPEIIRKAMHKKKTAGKRWRMDETYIKIRGKDAYLFRAVDKAGNTVDFYVSEKRDTEASLAFFKKAIDQNGRPELVNIDGSRSNKAALEKLNLRKHKKNRIVIRKCKYLNNIIEQDHRGPKLRVIPMLGFKSKGFAEMLIAGVEFLHMIKKDQFFIPYQFRSLSSKFNYLAS
jgi:transposase-like protein